MPRDRAPRRRSRGSRRRRADGCTRPCSIPSRRTSWTKLGAPVTLPGRSTRGTLVPTTVCCSGRLIGARPVAWRSKRWSPISSPYDARLDGSPWTATTPASIWSCPVCAPSWAAASSSSACRASALACRSAAPAVWIVLLPGRVPLVRGAVGVAHLHPDLADRHVQLLGHDLRQRRPHAGPQLDLAAEDGDALVAADHQPGVDRVRRAPRRRSAGGADRRGGAAACRQPSAGRWPAGQRAARASGPALAPAPRRPGPRPWPACGQSACGAGWVDGGAGWAVVDGRSMHPARLNPTTRMPVPFSSSRRLSRLRLSIAASPSPITARPPA